MKIVISAILILFFGNNVFCQQKDWYHKDLSTDSVFGVSSDRAYKELLQHKPSKKVIVAIIDSGIDTLHEDLKPVLWTDAKTGNHGWNYIGQETGQEDVTRLVGNKKEFYDSLSYGVVPEIYRVGYQQFKQMEPALSEKRIAMDAFIDQLQSTQHVISLITAKIGKQSPTVEDFKLYQPQNAEEGGIVKVIIDRFHFYTSWEQMKFAELDHLMKLASYHLEHGLNPANSEPDTATGDGNVYPDAVGLIVESNQTPMHGTHVAGIIGAQRNNGKGMDGLADNVSIMMLKVNGNIRELRDKNLANAILFAVDHGAKVINLSFGKPYTWDKKDVDAAVAYATKKNVLMIHAAGNSSANLDEVKGFPNPGDKANWIEVGASGLKDEDNLPARFSNYGQVYVDVFAPGVQIYSCIPGSKYEFASGTSMAAPVVAGVAAVLMEYFPRLKASEVKNIIINSVVKRECLKDKCSSSGVVNLYNAVQLAMQNKGK